MKKPILIIIAIGIAALLSACTPPPPAAYQGLDGVSAKAVTVILGAPLVDGKWDAANGPVTWRREILQLYNTPQRRFRNGLFRFDSHTTHEFLLTCDLTARLNDGRIEAATLSGAPRACNAVRADAEKVTALLDVLQEEVVKEATQ